MKKKIAILTAVVALIVVFAVVLTSCGIADKVSSLIPGGGDGDGNTISPANDYDSTQIESHINALAAQGIKISLRVTGSDDDEGEYEAETYAYGAYGDIFYYCYGEEDEQMYFDLSSDDQFVLYQMEQDGFDYYWTKTIYYYDDLYSKAQLKQVYGGMAVGIWGMLGYYAGLNGNGTKTTATMLGRTCDKYVMTQSVAVIGAAASISYECWIDQQTGVCLKYAISGSAVSTDGRESGSFAIEATEFNTNWRPQLPQVSQAHTEVMNPESAPQGGNGSQGQGGNGNESQGEGGGNQSQGEGGQGEGGGNQGQQPGADGTIGGGEDESGSHGGQGEGGGQVIGGEGEGEQETSEFINKRLEVTEVFTDDTYKALFEDAHIDFYSNGRFEFVSGLGVIIGTYEEFAQYHRVVLNAYLIYKDEEYSYKLPDGISGSMIMVYGNPAYLWRIGEVEVEPDTYETVSLYLAESNESPEASEIPDDPNGRIAPGDFDNYQVTQEVWEGIFEGDWLFEEYGNFRVDYNITGGAYPTYGLFMVDGDIFNDDDEIIHVRQTFEKDENGQYTFNEYYHTEGWQYYGKGYFDLSDWWDQFTGAIPAPFLKAGYNSISHKYYINSFSYTPVGESKVSITNFGAWFESGLLIKVQFTKNGETYTYEFSDYDSVDLEDPAA